MCRAAESQGWGIRGPRDGLWGAVTYLALPSSGSITLGSDLATGRITAASPCSELIGALSSPRQTAGIPARPIRYIQAMGGPPPAPSRWLAEHTVAWTPPSPSPLTGPRSSRCHACTWRGGGTCQSHGWPSSSRREPSTSLVAADPRWHTPSTSTMEHTVEVWTASNASFSCRPLYGANRELRRAPQFSP